MLVLSQRNKYNLLKDVTSFVQVGFKVLSPFFHPMLRVATLSK